MPRSPDRLDPREREVWLRRADDLARRRADGLRREISEAGRRPFGEPTAVSLGQDVAADFEKLVVVDAEGGSHIVSLPWAASSDLGRAVAVRDLSTSGTITVRSDQLIEGSETHAISDRAVYVVAPGPTWVVM